MNLFLAIAVILSAAHVPSPSSAAHHTVAAPAPAVDCTSLIMNMADCLSFVSNDSTTTKPEPTCCSGLKTVLQADADCLCEAFKSSAQLGVVLNVTKALTLPAACKLSAPSASTCSLTQSPVAAPGPSGAGGAVLSPYPGTGIGPSSPGNSAISGRTMPFACLISAIVFSLLLTLEKM